MSKINISVEGMNIDKRRFVTYRYPDCIVNRITKAFVFEEDRHGYKATSRNGTNHKWTSNNVVMTTHIEFVRFVCDFMINEMFGLPLCQPASTIDDVIDVISELIYKFGRTPNGYNSNEEEDATMLELEAELRKDSYSYDGDAKHE